MHVYYHYASVRMCMYICDIIKNHMNQEFITKGYIAVE